MALPIYDESVLPCLIRPFGNDQDESTVYLGNKYIEGDIYMDVRTRSHSQAEQDALYQFWSVDCNHGTTNFLLDAPLFGVDATYEVKFLGKYVSSKGGGQQWKSSFRLLSYGQSTP